MTDRRAALRNLGGCLLASLAGCAGLDAEPADELVLAAGKRGAGPVLAAWTDAGELLYTVPMPARLHGFARRPGSDEAVVFERRPGIHAYAFGCRSGRILGRFGSPGGRHFQGHGAFSRDGRLLFASENDFERGRGVIGVYAAEEGYRHIGAFASGGIGPHEILSMRHRDALVVANGGVLTHPATGRMKRNRDTMQTSLVILDTGDGRERYRFEPDTGFRQLSIRHLALARDDTIVFAAQYYGPAEDRPPLLGLRRPGADAAWLPIAGAQSKDLANYIGSVAISGSADRIALSVPRANGMLIVDADGGQVEKLAMQDGCGIRWTPRGTLWLSSGTGAVVRRRDGGSEAMALEGGSAATLPVWDNHLG